MLFCLVFWDLLLLILMLFACLFARFGVLLFDVLLVIVVYFVGLVVVTEVWILGLGCV